MTLSGRVGSERGSGSSPETCLSQAGRGKNFERVGKDGLWPTALVASDCFEVAQRESPCFAKPERQLGADGLWLG